MLLTSAQQVADKRLYDAQKQVRWQYDEMQKLLLTTGKDFDLNKNKE